jgi:hypothetical protein
VGLVTIFYCSRFETSLFVTSYDSQGYGVDIQPHLQTGVSYSASQSQFYITTDGQSASQSWNEAPMWGLQPDIYYCHTVAGLLMWGALSDEKRGLWFARVTVSCNKSVVST